MGRGERCADDPAERLVFIRQQPRENLAGSPLAGIAISRLQFRFSFGDGGGLIVENVGMGTVLGVPRPLDVRVVCATNEGEISLRRDVLKRFSFVIRMPRLKDRLEDVPLIVRALVLQLAVENPALAGSFVTAGPDGSPQAKIAPALVLALLRCTLDGNGRDVRNVLLRAMAESQGLPAIMPPEDMTQWLPYAPVPPSPASNARIRAEVDDLMAGLGQVKPPVPAKGRLLEGLERSGWQIEATGTYLGISRHAVKRLMKKYGIRRPGEPEAKPGGDPDDDLEDDPQ